MMATPALRYARPLAASPVRLLDELALGFWTRFAGVLALLLGVGLLSRAFTVPGYSAESFLLFWGGVAACYAAALSWGLGPGRKPWHQVTGLALLGAALYLPTFLRSPANLLFQDELYHFQSLVLMRDLATTHIPITFFPIAGDYPGLEFVALAGMQGGLPLEAVVRIIPLALHVLIPVLAFLAMRAAGLRPASAFTAALLYMSNTSFYFFHAIFSYESLGILLFLLVALLSLQLIGSRWDHGARRLLIVGALIAIVVTHHVSGLLTVGFLVTVLLASLVVRWRHRPALGNTALFAGCMWAGWLIYRAGSSVLYLSYSLTARVTAILSFISAEQHQTRQLFKNSPLPLVEQLVARLYPMLIAGLVVSGMLLVFVRWRRGRLAPSHLLRLLALGIAGPVLWLGSAPLVFTSSSDVVYRAWPFLFLGVALFGTLGIEALSKRVVPWAALRRPAACLGIAFIMAGGIIVGDNQAGRFRSAELHAAAGPEVETRDLLSAAEWLESTYGRFNKVWGDMATATVFSAFGIQDARAWGAWYAYYADDPGSAEWYVDDAGVKYVVVDKRDAEYAPRYQFFFNSAETYDNTDYDPSVVMSPALLEKFDHVVTLDRVYDNGDIIIYARNSLPGEDE